MTEKNIHGLFSVFQQRGGVDMEYKKPAIVAQNNKNGSFAAGCPTNKGCNVGTGGNMGHDCRKCEVAK